MGGGWGWSKLILFIFFTINPGARVSDFFFTNNPNLYIYKKKFFLGRGGGGGAGWMARVSDFLSSPLAVKRDIVVTI